jgi:hypothetical protein
MGFGAHSQLLALKGGERGMLKVPGYTRKRDKLIQLHGLASKSNQQVG